MVSQGKCFYCQQWHPIAEIKAHLKEKHGADENRQLLFEVGPVEVTLGPWECRASEWDGAYWMYPIVNGETEEYVGDGRGEANSRYLCAAWDLLVALEGFQVAPGCFCGRRRRLVSRHTKACEAAQAAIAKARGPDA